jgi:hypothetical protein
MDSEEEYMSAMSTDDEMLQDDSGDQLSGPEGMFLSLSRVVSVVSSFRGLVLTAFDFRFRR